MPDAFSFGSIKVTVTLADYQPITLSSKAAGVAIGVLTGIHMDLKAADLVAGNLLNGLWNDIAICVAFSAAGRH